MNRILIASLIASLSLPANAADMPKRHEHVIALSSQVDMLATEMAQYRAVAVACRATDGTNLSAAYWSPKLAIVPTSQKTLFAATVKSRSAPIIASMSGPDRALQCDDALDRAENAFPSVAEVTAAGTPLCWSDVTGTNACAGTGDDNILAGVDALLDGY